MKHIPKVILIVIFYIILLVLYGYSLYPSQEKKNAVKQMGMDDEGNVYLAGRSTWDLWLMQVDERGNQKVFRCSGGLVSDEAAVSLACDGGTLYVQQSWFSDKGQVLKVFRFDKDAGELVLVWEDIIDEDVDLCDFQVEKSVIFSTGIKCRTEEVFVYSNEEGEKRALALKGEIPVNACRVKSGVRVLTESQELYCFLEEDARKMYLKNAVYLQAGKGGFFLQRYRENKISYYDVNEHLICQFPLDEYVRNVQTDKRNEHLAVLCSDGERDRLFFYGSDGKRTDRTEGLKIPAGFILRELALPLAKFTGIYFFVVLFVLFVFQKAGKKKKMQYQMFFTVSLVTLFWVLAAFLGFGELEALRLGEDLQFNAGICNDVQKQRLLRVFKPEFFQMDSYLGSAWQGEVKTALSNENVLDAWEQNFIHTEVIKQEEREYYVVFSEERAFGANLACAYHKDAFEEVLRTCDRNFENGERTELLLSWNGGTYAASISPIKEKEGMYILTKFPVTDLDRKTGEALKPMLLSGILGWLFLVLFFLGYLRLKWRPLKAVVSQMEKISKGDFKMPAKNIPDNEFGVLWASLGRMCSVMEMEDYKKKGTLNFMYQFTPKSFEKLFQKNHLYEMEAGEMSQVFATVGTIFLAGEETLVKESGEKGYITYINRLLEELFRHEHTGKGIFFQDDGTLQTVKVLFPGKEGAGEGVDYGIVCAEELGDKPEEGLWKNPFLFFHTSRYLCGLAGGRGSIFPFVASKELEILKGFFGELKKSGVVMAVTQETKQNISEKVQTRYLGYVSLTKEGQRFLLHEVLDACQGAAKEEKIRTKNRFAQGLKLFYQNEFYQARSRFLEVLKECRGDGIARWYVFRCEEVLHGDKGENFRHDLFCGEDVYEIPGFKAQG